MRKSVSQAEELIFKKIYVIRDTKVLLDVDLAELYGVETKRLKEAVKRNIERFPNDFMFIFAGGELPTELLKRTGVRLRTSEVEARAA